MRRSRSSILDLEERGLLNRTLVVLASEFGRDAITEGKVGNEVKDQANTPDVMSEPEHYGMHRHFTAAGSVLLFGGGIKKGMLYGKTADERPCTTIENPVPMEEPARDDVSRAGDSAEPGLRLRQASGVRRRGMRPVQANPRFVRAELTDVAAGQVSVLVEAQPYEGGPRPIDRRATSGPGRRPYRAQRRPRAPTAWRA